MSLVIIGSGLAGYTVAREFRKLDQSTALTLITSDDGAFYSKPMLSNALSRGKDAAGLVTSSADEMRANLNATIMTATEVKQIDPEHRVVMTSSGDVTYDSLVLACGAIPFRPPIAGDAAEEVLSINNLTDYAHFRERLERAKRVAIIGPGLIGCEFANDLVTTEREVAIIGPDPHPISTLLPATVGKALQAALTQRGVKWHLGTTAAAVNREDSQYCITLESGAKLMADLVISAVGLHPNTALAESAGLDINRGVVTNRLLETSVKSIYAVGDCAEVVGLNLPFVAPLMAGARALAKTLSSTPTEVVYPAMPVAIKTPACPLVVSPPPRGAAGEWSYAGEPPDIAARFSDADGNLLGFALAGDAVKEKQLLTAALPPLLS